MRFDKLKPGMVVFSVGKMRMGNTAIKTVVVHEKVSGAGTASAGLPG